MKIFNSKSILDLGGAPTQIALEPAFARPDNIFLTSGHQYDLAFAEKMHVLYQHSYLGYGLMHAWQHVHQLVNFMASIHGTGGNEHLDENWKEEVVSNLCLSHRMKRVVEVEDPKRGGKQNVTMDRGEVCYEMVLLYDSILSYLWPYFFLFILSLVLLDLILSGGIILFLKDTFHLIGIWSCGHYYKVQWWTYGEHMPDTCLPHVVHMYYCALLCNAVCTAFYIVLLIPFHFTYQSCIPLTNLCHSCLLLIVISFTHCMCIFDS